MQSKKAKYIASVYSLPLLLLLFYYYLNGSWVILFQVPAIFICASYVFVFCKSDLPKLIPLSILATPFLTLFLWAVFFSFNPSEDGATVAILVVISITDFIQNIIFFPFFRMWARFLYARFYE